MKKIFLLFLMALMGFTSAYSQGHFKVGANAGIPVGDASDVANFQLGADIGYMFDAIPLLEVGGMLGYSHFFNDQEVEFGELNFQGNDVQFLPVALSARAKLPTFFVGLDLGYAFGLNDGNDGGFYYRPHVGYDFLMLGLILSYQGISVDGTNIASVNIGAEFSL